MSVTERNNQFYALLLQRDNSEEARLQLRALLQVHDLSAPIDSSKITKITDHILACSLDDLERLVAAGFNVNNVVSDSASDSVLCKIIVAAANVWSPDPRNSFRVLEKMDILCRTAGNLKSARSIEDILKFSIREFPDVIPILLKHGTDPNYPITILGHSAPKTTTPLTIAASVGNIIVFKQLLNKGADPEGKILNAEALNVFNNLNWGKDYSSPLQAAQENKLKYFQRAEESKSLMPHDGHPAAMKM
jgi:hypothetical protein